jgi:hypothetical protein
MAWVAVSRQRFRTGSFPAVCAKTGAPADGHVDVTATSNPGWTWILLLFGIFPFLIARAFARVRVGGAVPMSTPALRRSTVAFRVTLTLAGAASALIILAVIFQASAAAVVGASLLVASLLSAAVQIVFFSVGATVSSDGEEITLYGCSRAFVAAIRGTSALR